MFKPNPTKITQFVTFKVIKTLIISIINKMLFIKRVDNILIHSISSLTKTLGQREKMLSRLHP